MKPLFNFLSPVQHLNVKGWALRFLINEIDRSMTFFTRARILEGWDYERFLCERKLSKRNIRHRKGS